VACRREKHAFWEACGFAVTTYSCAIRPSGDVGPGNPPSYANECHRNCFPLYRGAGVYEVTFQVFAKCKGMSRTSFSTCSRVDDVAGARLRDARPRLSVSGYLKHLGGVTCKCPGMIESVACSSFTNSTVLSILTSQRVFGRRNEENQDALVVHRSAMPTIVERAWSENDCYGQTARVVHE
jgi:hypothetical protein